MRIAVVGLGYVGLPLAIQAAKAGHSVVGVDVNGDVVSSLLQGSSHVETVNDSELKAALAADLTFTTDAAVMADCDIVVICVPTPLGEDREPDLSALESASHSVAQHVKAGALVINESTSYPGTLRELIAPIVMKGQATVDFASAPERIDPGSHSHDVSNTPRVVGGLTEAGRDRAIEFYSQLGIPVVPVASADVAETAKLFENTFRQVNIALVNELAQTCAALNIPVWDVLDAAATKPFGFMKFRPSAGVGGHCIPVDPAYLSWRARQAGQENRFINIANELNADMPKYVARRFASLVPQGAKVTLIGVAYKPDVADVRETPAEALVSELRSLGFDVDWHDPVVEQWQGEKSASLGTSDGYVVVTAHSSLNWDEIKKLEGVIFDTTGALRGSPNVAML